MTDAGRKDVTDQIGEKITPDSQKSTLDKASETVSQAADKAMAAVQPEGSKSTQQSLSDTVRGGGNDASQEGKSYLQSAQEVVGNVLQSATDAVKGTGSGSSS